MHDNHTPLTPHSCVGIGAPINFFFDYQNNIGQQIFDILFNCKLSGVAHGGLTFCLFNVFKTTVGFNWN